MEQLQDHSGIKLPTAPDAEMAILACIIDDTNRFAPKAWESEIDSTFFHSKANASLYALLMERTREGKAVDPASIKEAIRAKKPDGLTVAHVLDVINVEKSDDSWVDYLNAVRDTHSRRLLIRATMDADTSSGLEAITKVRQATEAASAALAGLSAVVDGRGAIDLFKRACLERKDNGQQPGLSTGIEALDTHTGGMRKGELWVVGAQTSGGKSILMLQMAAQAISEGKKVVIFTMELGVDEVVGRLISFMENVPISEIMKPQTMSKISFEKVKRACDQIEASGLFVCDNPDVTIDTISGHCVRLKESRGLDLVVIDYVQMVNVAHIKGQGREQEVAGISRACKQLAKRAKCPVLTATQLNAEGKSRESRAIEHDADNVLLIDHDNDKGGCNITFWKCRNGQRGAKFNAVMDGLHQKFKYIEPA